MPEKDDVSQSHQYNLFEKRVPQSINRSINQLTSIVKRFDADAFRKAGRNLRNFPLHTLDDFHGIFTGTHHYDTSYDLSSIHIQRAAPEISTQLYFRHFS